MPKAIDDTQMLDRIADAIVSGEAKHPTAAIRAMGYGRGHPVERRLLKKWKDGRRFLLLIAEKRRDRVARERAIADAAFHNGYSAGRREALDAMRQVGESGETVTVQPVIRSSWFSRVLMWMGR